MVMLQLFNDELDADNLSQNLPDVIAGAANFPEINIAAENDLRCDLQNTGDAGSRSHDLHGRVFAVEERMSSGRG